jgi:hypothetical protein
VVPRRAHLEVGAYLLSPLFIPIVDFPWTRAPRSRVGGTADTHIDTHTHTHTHKMTACVHTAFDNTRDGHAAFLYKYRWARSFLRTLV